MRTVPLHQAGGHRYCENHQAAEVYFKKDYTRHILFGDVAKMMCGMKLAPTHRLHRCFFGMPSDAVLKNTSNNR
jgi:hypothetical protein